MSGFAYIKGYRSGIEHFNTGVMILNKQKTDHDQEIWGRGFKDGMKYEKTKIPFKMILWGTTECGCRVWIPEKTPPGWD